MGFGLGRQDHRPARAGAVTGHAAPAAPTEDDLLAALARVEAMVAAGAVPAPVRRG